MDNVLYNDLCVRLWRVPFVVLVFTAFVFVSGAWGDCYDWNPPGQQICWVYHPQLPSGDCVSDNYNGRYWTNCSNLQSGLAVARFCITSCGNKCEADSISCFNKGEGFSWNTDNCTCDSLSAPDTTYQCVNTTMASGTYGERPIAHIYRCVTTGSSSDVCTRTSELNGTCEAWNFCQAGESSCIIPPDSLTHKMPCTRSGGNTTSSGRCYYQCPDGTALSCTPTSTEYVAGAIYVGTCPDRPPQSCLPPSPGPSSSGSGTTSSSSEGPVTSSSSVAPDTLGPGVNIDYTHLLNAIRDTLHVANRQREILEDWDLDFMRPVKESMDNIEDYSLYEWQKSVDINNQLTTLQDRPFDLKSDIKRDLDSSRLLLDEIKTFLAYDSIKTYSSDTSANGLLREIRDKMPSNSSLSKSDSLKAQLLKDTFRPYLDSAPVLSIDSSSLLGKLVNVVSSNFGRDSADLSLCSSYYSCLRDGDRDCISRYPGASSKCVDGGTPLDGVLNVEMGILETLWDAIFGDDNTPIPSSDDSDTNAVLPPGFSSASAELQRANDSLGSFDVRSMVDSVRSMIDSAKKINNDTTKIQPDSLWLDSSGARRYVEHILLPSGTGTDCFICHADLGTFGGLSDTSLKVHIDFSNFGGYNWCDIIRAVVRIATLVVCISLTLGSWAAAFGYNPKNDA